MTVQALPPSNIPIFTTVAAYREWRQRAFDEKKSVGYVPTMGALHDGHLSLVKRSLQANDLTVLSIFVNPAQFAPHEDLASYPRTLPHDLALLNALSVPAPGSDRPRTPSALFLPSVPEMYPSGISQDVARQRGTFVEVAGFAHQMEGAARPTFFRGVATVVTKLFGAVQPTRAYFGQKDIQQALLLRRLARDLLLAHPAPERVHIVPTARDPATGLALSSRNAYLAPAERAAAPALYQALCAARDAWGEGAAKAECVARAREVVSRAKEGAAEGVDIRLDYVDMNDSETFDVLENAHTKDQVDATHPAILSGAMWVGRTRLIDNIILGNAELIVSP